MEREHLVVLRAELLDGVGWPNGERQHPTRRAGVREPSSDCCRRGSGRDTIVDDDHVVTAYRVGVDDTREPADAFVDLLTRTRERALDPGLGRTEATQQVIVHHRDAVRTDRADRELLVARRAHLASDDGAQRTVEHARDLGGHDDATARDPADERILGRSAASEEPFAELPSCIDAVEEDVATTHRYAPDESRARGVRMAISAYVLIQTEVGKAGKVAEAVRAIQPGVIDAHDVTGPYDVIVRTEADSLDDLGKMVVSKIQAVEGITRTFTCPVVNL